MKRLETTSTKEKNFFSRVRHATTTSVNSLSTWGKMLLNVGCVIIGVVILGALLESMALIANLRSGTQYRTDRIFKDLLTSLWNDSLEKTKQKLRSRRNS